MIEGSSSASSPKRSFSPTRTYAATPPSMGPIGSAPSEEVSKKKSSLWLKITLPVVLGLAVVIGGIAFAVISNSKATIHLTTTKYRSTCGELDSGDAVFSGATVRVRDAQRHLVGSGALNAGRTGHGYNKTNHWVSTCTFKTDITVPKNQSTYLISVGSATGGSIAFNRRDLVRNGWEASITVSYNYDPPTYNTYGSSYSDGYNWGYYNAYSSSDCDWWANGPSYDNSSLWESGCLAGYYDSY